MGDAAEIVREIREDEPELTDRQIWNSAHQDEPWFFLQYNNLADLRDWWVEYYELTKPWVARLRSIPRRDLMNVDSALCIFVILNESPFFMGRGKGLDVVHLFTRWLKAVSFRCEHCGQRYVLLIFEPKGPPRRFCSNSCKQAAWRVRRETASA